MSYQNSATTSLVEFYERRVLPNLFERLDQAFPEIRWTRTPSGWIGLAEDGPARGGEAPGRQLVCNQPWGFTVQDGTSASWLAYANGGSNPTGGELLSAVRKLAKLAGVHDTTVEQPLSRQEQTEAHRHTRYRELLEAFSAYASACLYSAAGKPVLDRIRDDYGVDPEQLATTTLGVYTNTSEVREYLQSVGFSEDEILASYLTRDSRLAGRVTIPWRDPWGNLRTVVAHDLTGKTPVSGGQLFLKGSSRPEFFGLDVALRTASAGKRHLLLVGNLIEVAICHARGLCNVAASGNRGGAVSDRQWRTLSSLGVDRATLALGDEPPAWRRTRESLTRWLLADCRTHPFALPCGSLGTTPHVSGYVRSHGNDAICSLALAAPHGCKFLAGELIRDHRTSEATFSDAAIVDVLREAVEMDARATEPNQSWTIERFFWPAVLDAIQLDWQEVHGLLERRHSKILATREETKKTRIYKLLAADLTSDAGMRYVERFEKRILAAAAEIRQREKHWMTEIPQPEPMPVLPPISRSPAAKPPVEDHWQETVVESSAAGPNSTSPHVTANDKKPASKSGNSPTDESIRRRAYRLWEKAGHPTGQHLFFWQEAERQLLAESEKPA